MIWWLAAALAGTLTLNGVEVSPEALSGLQIRDAEVEIDRSGNVHVTAPGYAWADGRLMRDEPRAARELDTWVVLLEDMRSEGMEATVYLGDVRVRRHPSGSGAVVVPVPDLIRPGSNDVRVAVSARDRASGRVAVTVARARRVDGTYVLLGEPSRYLVHASQVGDLLFQVDGSP